MRVFFRNCFVLFWALFFVTSQAQVPVVVQADKVSRVGASRNYVLNPFAQTNTVGVTASSATVSRSTITPIGEAGTEFNVTITAANGTVTWATAPQAQWEALKGAQCEARWKYRGFQSTTLFQVRQGGVTQYQVPATVSTTNVTPGSIPFPCGDLSSATTFVVTDTATLSGTNEISDVEIGAVKAFGDAANITTLQTYPCTVSPITGFSTAPVCTYRRVGEFLEGSVAFIKDGSDGIGGANLTVSLPSGLNIDTAKINPSDNAGPVYGTFLCFKCAPRTTDYDRAGTVTFVNATTFRFVKPETSSAMVGTDVILNAQFSASFRFPIVGWSASNAAVSPSATNLSGNRKWNGATIVNTDRSTPTYLAYNDAGYATGTNSGNATTCASANDLCVKIPSVPAGRRLKVTAQFSFINTVGGDGCIVALSDTNSGAGIFSSANQAPAGVVLGSVTLTGTYNSTTFGDKEFYILGQRTTGTGACRVAGGDSGKWINIVVEDLDRGAGVQFIQSPVRAAGTGVAPLAGEVGELITANSASSAAPTTSAVAYNVMSLPVTAGVWDCTGHFFFLNGTISGKVYAIASLSSNTGAFPADNQYTTSFQNSVGTEDSFAVRSRRFVFTTSQSVFLIGQVLYTTLGTGTSSAGRSSISCVRIGDR